MLYVRSSRHVDDKIAEILPVAHHVHGARSHFGIRSRKGDVGSKGAVNAEHDGLGVQRQHGHVELDMGVVTLDAHPHLVHAQGEALFFGQLVLELAMTIGERRGVELPLVDRRVVRREEHDVNVDFFARERKVKRAVAELGAEYLRSVFGHDHVVGAVVRR